VNLSSCCIHYVQLTEVIMNESYQNGEELNSDQCVIRLTREPLNIMVLEISR
jgi:hypothetical protein